MKNPVFPIFSRDDLDRKSKEITAALSEYGIVYISGFEDQILAHSYEFTRLFENSESGLHIEKSASEPQLIGLLNIVHSPEFKKLKREYLGSFYRNNLECFFHQTGQTSQPPSGELHFDRRQTFKVWAYISDVGEENGAMRVVPHSILGEDGNKVKRLTTNRKRLFDQGINVHLPSNQERDVLEALAQAVTGRAGTVFLHDTDAWHGASEVKQGLHRKIIRSHSRPFSDYFLKKF